MSDYDMEAEANEPLVGDPRLADLERQQRRAYWKGEQAAASRLVPFDPRNPLAGAALKEAEAMEQAMEERLARQVTPEKREAARMALEEVERGGGEMDPAVQAAWVQFSDSHYGTNIAARPKYEQKAAFFKWLRNMENWERGEDIPEFRGHAWPEPTEEEKFWKKQNDQSGRRVKPRGPQKDDMPAKYLGKDQKPMPVDTFPGLSDEVRPEGIEVG